MFFILSKLLVPLETPSDLLLILLVAGTVLAWSARFRRAGLVTVSLVAGISCLIALFPVPGWVAAPLENRFPRPAVLPQHVDGIIVLGGAVKPEMTAKRGVPSLNFRAERMTEFVRLAKLYPQARLVFSGGDGRLHHSPFSEADAARLFFRQQGLDTRRILFENKSRNTYENVVFSKALARPAAGQVWLLVSSAQDIPRSVGIFRAQGWPVIPIPVAYKAGGTASYFSESLFLLDDGMHEWLGLLAYYLTGRTDALFPAPG